MGLLLPKAPRSSVCSFANLEGNLGPEDCVYGSRRTSEASFDQFCREILPAFRESSEAWCRAGLDRVDPAAFHRTAQSLVQWSDGPELMTRFRNWGVRKLYVYGSENSGHPTTMRVSDLPSAGIPGSGHFMMLDNPTAFYDELAAFIGFS